MNRPGTLPLWSIALLIVLGLAPGADAAPQNPPIDAELNLLDPSQNLAPADLNALIGPRDLVFQFTGTAGVWVYPFFAAALELPPGADAATIALYNQMVSTYPWLSWSPQPIANFFPTTGYIHENPADMVNLPDAPAKTYGSVARTSASTIRSLAQPINAVNNAAVPRQFTYTCQSWTSNQSNVMTPAIKQVWMLAATNPTTLTGLPTAIVQSTYNVASLFARACQYQAPNGANDWKSFLDTSYNDCLSSNLLVLKIQPILFARNGTLISSSSDNGTGGIIGVPDPKTRVRIKGVRTTRVSSRPAMVLSTADVAPYAYANDGLYVTLNDVCFPLSAHITIGADHYVLSGTPNDGTLCRFRFSAATPLNGAPMPPNTAAGGTLHIISITTPTSSIDGVGRPWETVTIVNP